MDRVGDIPNNHPEKKKPVPDLIPFSCISSDPIIYNATRFARCDCHPTHTPHTRLNQRGKKTGQSNDIFAAKVNFFHMIGTNPRRFNRQREYHLFRQARDVETTSTTRGNRSRTIQRYVLLTIWVSVIFHELEDLQGLYR
jgi:hypothetical protein